MAIRFNFITNKEGISIIINELLDNLGIICYQDYFNKENHIIKKSEDFNYTHFQPIIMYPKSMENYIRPENLSIYFEYHFVYDKKIPNIGGGELIYYAGKEFPELNTSLKKVFSKLKRRTYRISPKLHSCFNLTEEETLSILDNVKIE